jgi:hypothetical protein
MTEAIAERTSRIIFRNPKNMIWYLQRRPDQPASEASFVLGPNQTVEALDEAEEKLLASVGLIDIAKETPSIVMSIDALKKQLAEEQAKNATLIAQNQALRAKDEKPKQDSFQSNVKKR